MTKDVGKVGNNSPSFIIPVDSAENKNNIANFFARGAAKKGAESGRPKTESSSIGKPPPPSPQKSPDQPEIKITKDEGFVEADGEGDGNFIADTDDPPAGKATPTRKRKVDDDKEVSAEQDPSLSLPYVKKTATSSSLLFSPTKGSGDKKAKTISSTSNTEGKSRDAEVKKSPAASARGKPKQRKGQEEPATQKKITGFFANSS